jgi:hypothetical protein
MSARYFPIRPDDRLTQDQAVVLIISQDTIVDYYQELKSCRSKTFSKVCCLDHRQSSLQPF